MTRGRWLVVALAATFGVAPQLGMRLREPRACVRIDVSRVAVLRVDGTDLTDWAAAPALALLLQEGAAATLVLPTALLNAPPLLDAELDTTLAGRRAFAQQESFASSAPVATVLASTPDFVSIQPEGTRVEALIADSTRPSGSRLDLSTAEATLALTEGPIEIDVSDLWRTEHAYRDSALRDVWTRDSLETVVSRLATVALAADRPVLLASIVPPVHRQRRQSLIGAVAVLGGPRGTLHSSDDPGLPAGLLTPAGLVGILEDGTSVCARDARDGGLAAAALAASVADTRDGHLAVVVAALTLAAFSVVGGCWLLSRRRRLAGLRAFIAASAVGLFFLPASGALDGLLPEASPLGRVTVGLAGLLAGGALVSALRTRAAVAVGAVATLVLTAIAAGSQGLTSVRSLLAAPIGAGQRVSALDPITLGAAVAAMLLLAAWAGDHPSYRRHLSAILVFLGAFYGVILAHPSYGGSPSGGALLMLAALPAIGGLVATRRLAWLARAAYAAAASGILFASRTPEDPSILSGSVPAQPALWPVLMLTLGVLCVPVVLTTIRHRDTLARASFGQPALRFGLIVVLPILLVGLLVLPPQGTAAAAMAAGLALAGGIATLARR